MSPRERAHNFLVDHLGYPAVKWPPRLVDQLEASYRAVAAQERERCRDHVYEEGQDVYGKEVAGCFSDLIGDLDDGRQTRSEYLRSSCEGQAAP